MKNNKLALATVTAAAIMTAPVMMPVISSFAATTVTTTQNVEVSVSVPIYSNDGSYIADQAVKGEVYKITGTRYMGADEYYILENGELLIKNSAELVPGSTVETSYSETPAAGNFQVGNISAATVYDADGIATGQLLPVNTASAYTAIATINGKEYYRFADGYVLKTDVTATAATNEKTSVKGSVTVTAATNAILYNSIASPVMAGDGSVKTLPTATNWKAFFKTTINGVQYYNVGGNQYVKIADVHFNALAQPTPLHAVGTVHYVPGYGIQVWTHKHGFVYNADGSKKKLAHGTSWKVFSQLNIKGNVYYNLGGDQWIDANYINLK